MKQITAYESDDGSLHRTPESAIRRDLLRLINDNSGNIELSGRNKSNFSMSILLHKVYLATDMETLKTVINILNKAANLSCHVSDVGEVTPK